MTNKRKIQILKKVIKRFEKLIPKFKFDNLAHHDLDYFGICTYSFYKLFTAEERNLWDDNKENLTEFFKREFKITMPDNDGRSHKWELTAKGYQARIKACKDAIKRLEKDSK